MPETLLPLREQYRYVTYAPTGGRWGIDWTHEREWRWRTKNKRQLDRFESRLRKWGVVSEVKDIPGLDLYTGRFKGIGVIVCTQDESKKVFHDILALVDRKVIASETFANVLVSEDISTPEAIRGPDEEADAIAAASINLSTYLTPNLKRDKVIVKRIRGLIEQVESQAGPPVRGELGGCWLWLLDNVHPVTRALVNADEIVVNHEGKYLLSIDTFSDQRGLRQREEMVKRLAHLITAEFGVVAGCFSVLNSDNPERHLYYNDDFFDNELFYNRAWDGR